MEIILLQVFVSLMLVVGSILLLAYSAKQRDFEHADRLALLPLDGDEGGREEQVVAEGPGETPELGRPASSRDEQTPDDLGDGPPP